MNSNRLLSAATAALGVLAVAGCSAAGTSSMPTASSAASSAFAAFQPARTHGRPIPLAGKNYVYVGDFASNTVWIFPAGPLNPNPVGAITTGLSEPEGVAVDAAGNLYVANPGKATVTIYPKGSSSPSLTLSQSLTVPSALAVDSKGNVWVSNEEGGNQGSVVEFPAGKTTPSTIISGLNPYGVAVDSKDNLYVEGHNSTVAFVAVYPPGKTKPSKMFGQKDLLEPLGIAIGPSGDVYVCDYYYNDVFIYAAKTYKLLTKVFDEQGDTVALTLSQNKRLYVADGNQDVVSEVSNRGFGTVLPNRFHNDMASAFGVAADPPVAPGP